MKQYIYKFSWFILAILLLTGISCERDTNGPLPDEGMTEGAVAYLVFDEATTDFLVDLVNPDAFNLDYTLGTLFDPDFTKIQIVVVYNGDYTKQWVVVDNITSVPTTGSITMANIIAAIDDLNTSADVKEADEFHFFTVITMPDGRVFKMYDKIGDEQGVLMIGSGLVTAVADVEGVEGGVSVNIPVPCAFVKGDYIGVGIDCYEVGGGVYPVNITERVDLGDENTLVLQIEGLFGAETDPANEDYYTSYIVEINLKNFFMSADDQLVLTGDGFEYGLGRIWFEDFRNSELNTCKQYMTFRVVAGLNDTGYWWGPNGPDFYIGPGAQAVADGKKSDGVGDGTVLREEPVLR